MGINEDELDKLAENAREEIDRLRGIPEISEEQKSTSPVPGSFTWSGQLMQTTASGIVGVAGAGGAGGWASQAGPQLTPKITIGGYNDGMAYIQTQPIKHDKGVCQESYDKGYADGLKALSTPPPSTD